tara:strand:- start:275 stop:1171 length:897 start_codon:yes stop_codon:yes gene_type:complete
MQNITVRMSFYLKQNFITILLLLPIAIFFNCAGINPEIRENKEIFNELTAQANSYWNQRTNSKALNKAENLILKILQENPNDFENTVLLAKIKFAKTFFLESHPTKQNTLFLEATKICEEAVTMHPDFLVLYNKSDGDSLVKLFSTLTNAPESLLPGLYWWGKNFAHYLNARPVIERLSNRELLEIIMNRVITLDPNFHYGGAYRFFGMLYTKIPGLDIKQSSSFFDQAIKSNPHFLANSVFLAEYYHQKAGNREQFNKILTNVINANLTLHPEVMNDNWFYQKRAQTLLDNESSLFE